MNVLKAREQSLSKTLPICCEEECFEVLLVLDGREPALLLLLLLPLNLVRIEGLEEEKP